MLTTSEARSFDELRKQWQSMWPEALAIWSRYVQLHDPIWCTTVAEEKKEQLTGSFAMIRLVDHSIVISLRQVADLGLQRFAKEILAHEIGHHVYCPADLTDNARMLARIRRGLPTKEPLAPMVSNLYSDLLINDRLQRSASLDICGVYVSLGHDSGSRVWTLYMRIYESLWSQLRGTLVKGSIDPRLDQDALLGARLVRSYSKDWLGGAGRFAALCLPYLLEDEQSQQTMTRVWNDTEGAGKGGFPDGLADLDEEEEASGIHPSEDPELSGIGDFPIAGNGNQQVHGRVPGRLSGRKNVGTYRQPFEYREVIAASGVDLTDREITARYYRERALPHLISFPVRRLPRAVDIIPEGLELWEPSSPLEQIDWFGTLAASPTIIPGVTTRERVFGDSPGSDPELLPFDLYLGVDCSGSMSDPAYHLSYPVLAGAILALSALRAGSRVKVVLSGEPGQTISTDGFVRDQSAVLLTLTNYLGTGYSFGIHRLAETFTSDHAIRRPVHVLIISDHDMFSMLNETGSGRIGWDIARESLKLCGGGGTFVLQIPGIMQASPWSDAAKENIDQMRAGGWNVSLVSSMPELVQFAKQFSRASFQR